MKIDNEKQSEKLTEELIDFLIKEIEKIKEYIYYFVDIHNFTEETIWRGELNACMKIVKFIYEKRNNEKLKKIIQQDEY